MKDTLDQDHSLYDATLC